MQLIKLKGVDLELTSAGSTPFYVAAKQLNMVQQWQSKCGVLPSVTAYMTWGSRPFHR